MDKQKTLCYSCKHRFLSRTVVMSSNGSNANDNDVCLKANIPLKEWVKVCNGYEEGLPPISVMLLDGKIEKKS